MSFWSERVQPLFYSVRGMGDSVDRTLPDR
jgi:hypothetical protein